MRKWLFLLLFFLIPSALFAQDMKSFTFHTDATSGDGTIVDVTGLNLIGVTILGSATSNRGVTFEIADNVGTFTRVKCSDVDTLAVVDGIVLSDAVPHRFQCPVGGFKKFKVRISSGSTGTISAVGLGLSKAKGGPSTGGGGSSTPILLDLADDGIGDTSSITEIATIGDTDTIFTHPSIGKLLIDLTRKWPNAILADALATNPLSCFPLFVQDIDADGTLVCAAPGGGGGSSAFADLLSGTNVTAAMIIGSGASLTTSGTGSILATGATTNPANCSAGLLAAGVDALFAAEGCVDVATQVELDAHATLTNPHSSTSTNTPNRLVLRDASGNFAANIITGNLSGNATSATTFTGPVTDAQIPNLNLLSTGLTPSRCVETDVTGLLAVAAGPCGASGTTAFSGLVSGTNVSAAMIVGTGASLTASGTGSILSTGATTNPANCSGGSLAAGVDASFVAEGCLDVATQVELDAHAALTTIHGAVSTNVASRIVLRDPSGNFSANIITAALVGNASTATAFAADPAACGANLFATDQSASGVLTCIQPTFAMLAGIAVDAQIPNLNTLSTGLTGSRCVETDVSGLLIVAAGPCSTGSAATFSGLTGGTNTTAAMVVGSGATLSPSGTGIITANKTESRFLDQIDTSPIAVNCALYDTVRIDELSQPTQFNAPTTCTPTEDQKLVFMVFSTTARVVTFVTTANAFSAGYGVALPTTTYAGQWIKWGFHWNSILAKWVFDGTTQTTTYGTLGYVLTSGGVGVEPTYQPVAFITNPANCAFENAPLGVTTSGSAEGCFAVVTPTGVQVLENKELVSRWLDQADTGSISVDCSLYEVVRIDELSQTTTINAPITCTPKENQALTFMIFSTVARTLTYASGTGAFSAGYGLALPTTTYAGAWIKHGFHWNGVVARWVLDASTQTTTYGTLGQVLTSNGPGVEPSFQAPAAAGTGTIQLPVSGLRYPTSVDTPAQADGSESNFRVLFDNTVKWCAYWGPLDLNTDYVGSPVFRLKYSMVGAPGGGVVFGIYIHAYTSGDTADAVTDSYDSVNNGVDTAIPAVAGRAEEIVFALTAVDSMAANDLIKIKICREVAHASDTAGSVAELLTSKLEYAK